MTRQILRIVVNGTPCELLIEPSQVLLEVLRENLRLTGTKFGCELGECGVCTVLIDGEPALSCLTLAAMCQDKRVTTVEGLEGREADIVQRAFAEAGASQCGYCSPSMAVMLNYLLSKGREVDIREELSGNICRCTGYTKIIAAYKRCIELSHE
jgi:carbon-monoxide dehydrogenase small subunit